MIVEPILPEDIPDEVAKAAICGWNNVLLEHELSKYQNAPETIGAWKRAIAAAFNRLREMGVVE